MKRELKKVFSYARNELATDNILLNQGKILLNQGKILSALNQEKSADQLSDYEWKVFSQWGEDGIINFLISEVEITNTTFIEFGVEDFAESNCRFLLMNSDWRGFVLDGSTRNIEHLKSSYYFWHHDLQALAAFIDAENVNDLLKKSGFERDLGILSVDIDGNDYHVLQSIDTFEPRIIICEFNPIFGTERQITVPYDAKFNRVEKHYSHLYFGASIGAIKSLLDARGYRLIGTGMLGANAYFVKNTLLTDRLIKLSEKPYCFGFNWRESRDVSGKMNFLRAKQRLEEIKGLDVINIKTGQLEKL